MMLSILPFPMKIAPIASQFHSSNKAELGNLLLSGVHFESFSSCINQPVLSWLRPACLSAVNPAPSTNLTHSLSMSATLDWIVAVSGRRISGGPGRTAKPKQATVKKKSAELEILRPAQTAKPESGRCLLKKAAWAILHLSIFGPKVSCWKIWKILPNLDSSQRVKGRLGRTPYTPDKGMAWPRMVALCAVLHEKTFRQTVYIFE